MIRYLLATMLAVLVAVCPNADAGQIAATIPNSLAGTYTADMHGTVVRFKVEENNGHYTMAQYDNQNGSWLDLKREFIPLTKEAFYEKTGSHIDGYVAGMESGDMLVLHVPAGWTRGQFTTKTGYLLLWDTAYELRKDS
jgi:hypothetical protein